MWQVLVPQVLVPQVNNVRGRPFDSFVCGGLCFFVKKEIVQQIMNNK